MENLNSRARGRSRGAKVGAVLSRKTARVYEIAILLRPTWSGGFMLQQRGGLGVLPSHGENRGSSPLGSASDFNWLALHASGRLIKNQRSTKYPSSGLTGKMCPGASRR